MDDNFLTYLRWTGLVVGSTLQIALSQPAYVGAVIFVLAEADNNRCLIRLYAGSSPDDSSLNTECNGGSAFYQDGAVNCFVENVSYLLIEYEESTDSRLYFEEILIFSQYDAT